MVEDRRSINFKLFLCFRDSFFGPFLRKNPLVFVQFTPFGDCGGFLSLFLSCSLGGILSAGFCDALRFRQKIIYQIGVVGILLEIIAATIWNQPVGKDVTFPDRPGIEPRFREHRVEQSRITDLHIPNSQAQAFDACSIWNRA